MTHSRKAKHKLTLKKAKSYHSSINRQVEPSRLFLLNKPFKVICQFSPAGEKQTLAAFFPIPDLYPAGRLDFDSEGLVLLTNDGQLQHKLSHPSQNKEKVYAVQVEGTPTEEQLERLRQGIELKDGMTAPAKVQILANQTPYPPRNPPIRVRKSIADTWIEITITEGRNRQVRRMTAAVGLPTLRLIRTQVDKYTLDGLAVGEFKEVNRGKN